MSVTNILYHTREPVQSQRLLHGSVFQLTPRQSCVINRLFLWYWPLASGSLLVMTRPSGADVPQRKVNRAEWHNRYRRAHPSEAGGASATATQQLIVHRSLSLGSIAEIIPASFSAAQESKVASSAAFRYKENDKLSPHETYRANTLPSLYIQLSPPPFSSSTCIIHYATWKDLPGRDRRAGELGVSCGAGTCSSCESWDPFWTSGGMKTPALRLYSLMHTEQWSHTHTTHACAHAHTSADTHNYGVEVASNKLIILLRTVWNPNKTKVNQGGRAIIFWHQKDEEQIDSLLKLAWGPPVNLHCSRKKKKLKESQKSRLSKTLWKTIITIELCPRNDWSANEVTLSSSCSPETFLPPTLPSRGSL